jgi:hypothetical protein
MAFAVPVTDYRLYLEDQATPNQQQIADLASRMASQSETLVAVGLSRSYRNTDSQPSRHWLQVNNIID